MKSFKRLLGAIGVAASSLVGANTNTVVGTLPGDVTISKSGAANYRIPIEVPPGVNGLQPNLALVYDSQKRNGLLGVGWKLTGLSSITRCPSTLAQDGFIDGVDFDDNDKFCLNGDRLVATNGGTYGASGTEYRTEYASYRKIVSYGSAGSGPAYFKVWYKDNRIAEFGNTEDSLVEAQGKSDALSWAINKVEDRFGNAINFNYSENNETGEHYPASVVYAGATVSFTLENKPSSLTGFIHGSKITTSQQIKTIQIEKAQRKSKYNLSYEFKDVNDYARLANIQRCIGQQCLAPTLFQWEESHSGFKTLSNTKTPFNDKDGWNEGYRFFPMDVNGDGHTDLVARYGNGKIATWLSNGKTFENAGETTTPYTDADGWNEGYRFFTMDVNGDGRSDLVAHHGNGDLISWLSNGKTFEKIGTTTTEYYDHKGWDKGHRFFTMDVNGDGRTDLIARYGSGKIVTWLSNGQTFDNAGETQTPYTHADGWDEGYRFFTMDANGDGQTDLIARYGSGNIVTWLSNGKTFENVGQTKTPFTSKKGWEEGYRFFPMDVNGDGLTDLVARYGNGNLVSWLSNGINFEKSGTTSTEFYHDKGWEKGNRFFSFDVNGDGRDDLIAHYGNGDFATLLSNGKTFTHSGKTPSPYNTPDGWDDPLRFFTLDVNGNGLKDLVARYGNGNLQPFVSNWVRSRHITHITNGLGHTTKLTYKPLTNKSIYTKSSGSQYPVKDTQPSTYVVTQVEKANGIGGFTTTNYQYEGLKFHQQGLGSLGFAKISSTQVETGIKTINHYAQDVDSRKIGLLTHSQTLSKNGVVLKDIQQDWQVTPLSDGGITRYQTLLGSSTTIQKSLQNEVLSTVNQQLTYDVFGNVTDSITTTTDQYGSYTQTVNTTYDNHEGEWLLGLANRTTDTRTNSVSGSSLIRTRGFDFDSTTGALTSETIEPDNGDLILSTAYTYDRFGNPQTITQSGAKIETTVTQLAYTNDGRFLKSTTNALGHVTAQTTDPFWGVPLTTTDANNQVTLYQYDSFGRLKTQTRPDGTNTAVTRGWYQGEKNDPKAYWVTTQSSGSSPATVYFDTLGRSVQTQTIALTGQTTLVDTVYDSLGQVEAQSFPYFAGETKRWTRYQYDELLRPTQVTRPDNSVSATAYNGLTTVVTNALNQTKTTHQNALGQVVRVVDDAGSTLQYTYDAFGNLTQTTDPLSNITTIRYDELGRKIGMDDPDKGQWAYQYDALDRLVLQTDAKGQQTKLFYDKLDRLTKRIDNFQADKKDWKVSLWEYDTSYKGLLDKTESEYFKRQYRYDSLLRLTHSTQTSYNETFTVETQYDGFSRPEKTIYPTGLTIAQQYNAHGYLTAITDGQTQNPKKYWEAKAVDPFGNVSESIMGNGAATMRVVNPTTGRIQTIFTSMSSANLSDLNFQYDDLGNLTSREDKQLQVKETFEYDQLNRLTDVLTTIGNETETAKVAYDAIGNITFKSDVGSYGYGGSCNGNTAGPHAVTQTTGSQNTKYCYDKNGNMVSGNQRTIQYTAFDKPDLINNLKNGASTAFAYGADRARHRRVDTTSTGSSSQTNTTYYMGGIYEKVVSNSGKVQHKHYIADIAIITQTKNAGSDNGTKTHYLHRDHLDSIVLITDETAQEVERFSYDPWGKKRQTNWKRADDYTALASSITTRGFTNHENLDAVGLIHMNGRVYDPNLGRFLSADPFIPNPLDLQSFNRYSYVRNNPVSYLDPTGFERTAADRAREDARERSGWTTESRTRNQTVSVSPSGERMLSDYGSDRGTPSNGISMGSGGDRQGLSRSNESSTSSSTGQSNSAAGSRGNSVGVGAEGIGGFSGGLGGLSSSRNSSRNDNGSSSENSSNAGNSTALGMVQSALDYTSAIPGPIGSVTSIVSAGISLTQGEYGAAAIAVAGIIPGVALLTKALKSKKALETITLYRGVNVSHPAHSLATKGIVKPNRRAWQFWKKRSSALQHNVEEGGTLTSSYTSWSTNPEVALNFALRPNKTGVVIKAEVPISQTVTSPNLKQVVLKQSPGTVVSEAEVLVKGTVKGQATAVGL